MSEAERRRNYSYPRVLISSERILDPEFSDAVVFLSGAQVEMLRNVTQYLNRIETYVEEEHPGYYLTPDTADFDDILAIVADLEETLMGNPNTIFGYHDRLAVEENKIGSLPGTNILIMDSVPAGEVWLVDSIVAYNDTSVMSAIIVSLQLGSHTQHLYREVSPPASMPIEIKGRYVMKEDDYLRTWFQGCTSMDNLYFKIAGTIMKVPE